MSEANNQNTNEQQPEQQNEQQNQQQGGAPAFDYDKLAGIITGAQSAKEDSVLKNYFKQQGLSPDEMTQAISAFKEQKAKNTPNIGELQKSIATERAARIKAQLHEAGTLEAIKQGVAAASISHVLKLADYADCTDKEGKINTDKLSEAIKKVLDDVPAFKSAAENSGGVRVGGDGEGNGSSGTANKKTVPTKKWNRFNN